ncbi:HAAS signaling domain-containing protein [Streptomyces winkii]|uniref:HAAS signaling domain-containing protein n=1 Tax=Streptomyces winkii TaxID=3051178 RepID=UPI0028D4B4B8|nr:hypothetical protein [Streptomyces sp. DSM 40971]
MTSERNRLIDEYLRQLDNASVFLEAERRAELRQEIVEHIDAALEEADARAAEEARVVLERLGPPADIVAAELGGPKSTGSTPVVRPAGPGGDASRSHESGHEGRGEKGRDDAAASGLARSRKRNKVALLLGAAVIVLVISGTAFGISATSSGPGSQPSGVQETVAPSESESGGEPSATPTETESTPTETESTPPPTPSDTPTETETSDGPSASDG